MLPDALLPVGRAKALNDGAVKGFISDLLQLLTAMLQEHEEHSGLLVIINKGYSVGSRQDLLLVQVWFRMGLQGLKDVTWAYQDEVSSLS